MWRDRDDPWARELVEECEAFLEGRYVELLVDGGEPVPPWAWTNLLAHGTEDQLRHPPLLGATARSPLWAWSQGRAFLAGEVLDLAHAFPTLRLCQQAVLIPLELDLASAPSVCDLRPITWVEALQGRVARRTLGGGA